MKFKNLLAASAAAMTLTAVPALAVSASSTGSTATEAPAGQAGVAPRQTTTNTHLRGCFVHSNRQPAADLNVSLTHATFGKLRSGKTGSNGCATFFNIPRNGTYKIDLHQTYGKCGWPWLDIFSGSTGWGTIGAAATTYNFPYSFWVTHTRPC